MKERIEEIYGNVSAFVEQNEISEETDETEVSENDESEV